MLNCLCHDDGSAEYHDHHNVCIGFGLKNFLGHNLLFDNNLVVKPDLLGRGTPGGPGACAYNVPFWNAGPPTDNNPLPIPGDYAVPLNQSFVNNTCVLATTADPYMANCNWRPYDLNSTFGEARGNTYYAPTPSDLGFCGGTLSQVQSIGVEVGSKALASSTLKAGAVARLARRLLDF